MNKNLEVFHMKRNLLLGITIVLMLIMNTAVFANGENDKSTTNQNTFTSISENDKGNEPIQIPLISTEDQEKTNETNSLAIKSEGDYQGDTVYQDYTNIYIAVGVGILLIISAVLIFKRKK